ncbi:hypothetical protein SXCC_04290 [Gluconacetobacter sp. SXCC-1]|nr:hypothetical protein SXCC_04290 [Gluconacetobacter sp. SXCC-1]
MFIGGLEGHGHAALMRWHGRQCCLKPLRGGLCLRAFPHIDMGQGGDNRLPRRMGGGLQGHCRGKYKTRANHTGPARFLHSIRLRIRAYISILVI